LLLLQDYNKRTALGGVHIDNGLHMKNIPKTDGGGSNNCGGGGGRIMEYARLTAESSNSVVNRFYQIYEDDLGDKKGPPKASV
jgi:hypothetical protein